MLWEPWIRELRVAARQCMLLVVACFAVLVAAGPTLPALGQILGGDAPHICHCQVRPGRDAHDGCGCPICFPSLRDGDDDFGCQELVAKCGDDDPVLRSLAIPGVGAAGFVIAPPHAWADGPLPVRLESSQWSITPEIPPPIAAPVC